MCHVQFYSVLAKVTVTIKCNATSTHASHYNIHYKNYILCHKTRGNCFIRVFRLFADSQASIYATSQPTNIDYVYIIYATTELPLQSEPMQQ